MATLAAMSTPWAFDRHLRHDELTEWLQNTASARPGLMAVEEYGRSYEGRPLWLATITDSSTGAHDTKPAHWVDASIHATELTATVAACRLIQHLLDGFEADERTTEALRTRTFYVVPRVNPDGAEAVLADEPRVLRSSTRAWPWRDGHRWPGLEAADIDGDGRILDMRISDPNGAWTPHPDDSRLLVAVPAVGLPDDRPRYRVMTEGSIVDHDGWTIPTPRPMSGLDLNRNFPAGWSSSVTGAGDHPLSEPEIDALVRVIVARPNICGTNALHTSGGVLLRPSSTKPDSDLPPFDRWAFGQLGDMAERHTNYPVHSVYEDFTWDRSDTMSGAADDWAYEHLGVFSWTTEFWDVVLAATGTKQSTDFWTLGPTADEALAVLRWSDLHQPDGHVDWYPFDHPVLGPVELGGWNDLRVWSNPPDSMLEAEVSPHAAAAVDHALASPRLEILHRQVRPLGPQRWQIEIGVANTGWLATDVSVWARTNKLVAPGWVELSGDEVAIVGSARRQSFGQLDGRAALRFRNRNDGTPDRALISWIVEGPSGASVSVTAHHDRAGDDTAGLTLG